VSLKILIINIILNEPVFLSHRLGDVAVDATASSELVCTGQRHFFRIFSSKKKTWGNWEKYFIAYHFQ
jgi:hypothetical protein